MIANPIESDKQLALTMYRMAHGRSTKRFERYFWCFSSTCKIFDNVIRVMVISGESHIDFRTQCVIMMQII